jgi:hypothetical protein
MTLEHRPHNHRVRVSIVFDQPEGKNESPSTLLKRRRQNTRDKSVQLTKWLRDNAVGFWRLSEMDAFSTIYIDVLETDIPKIKRAPGVLEVNIEQDFIIDPLDLP